MTDEGRPNEFSPYVAKMLAYLFGRGEAGGEFDPSELDLHPGLWNDLTADKRPSSQIKRHG